MARPDQSISPNKLSGANQLQKLARDICLEDRSHYDFDAISATVESFAFDAVKEATSNFQFNIGEGGFGNVYGGILDDGDHGQAVAVKQLNKSGVQGDAEFCKEVLSLSLANHANLVRLIGYGADQDERLIVYELMPEGSLDTHIHDLKRNQNSLDWNTRIRIAAGIAKGVEYLHHTINPPVIHRDVKPANILLDDNFEPKLSDFGMVMLGPVGEDAYVKTNVLGTEGYCDPYYRTTGKLSFKSDVYNYGVLLLEILSGRKPVDQKRPRKERKLVDWALSLIKQGKLSDIADPSLQYPYLGLKKTLEVASLCVQKHPSTRPDMSDIAKVMSFVEDHIADSRAQITEHEREAAIERERVEREAAIERERVEREAAIERERVEREAAMDDAFQWASGLKKP